MKFKYNLDCGKKVQENFVNAGLLLFCCKSRLCKEAQKQARVTMNFIRVKQDLKQNLGISINLQQMGFQKTEVETFKVRKS